MDSSMRSESSAQSLASGGHTLKRFDQELEEIRRGLLEMGDLVQKQLRDALEGYAKNNVSLLDGVLQKEELVNRAELELDHRCAGLIARRQPAAGDLRLVIACMKSVTDLERIGDESEKIARISKKLLERTVTGLPGFSGIQTSAKIVSFALQDVLGAFSMIDVEVAKQVVLSDLKIDTEFKSLLRELITFMMEDPRTISTAMDIVWIAKALERIGDHAKNIAEYIIYIAQGRDVRHPGITAVGSADMLGR